MDAAIERLYAAQECQMALIEKSSTRLKDHVIYWGAVRTESTLMYAARKAGHKTLGHWPLPSLVSSAHKAREAIRMQALCAELAQSQWGDEPWSLADTSLERWHAPPECCLKKNARVVEVVYNRNNADAVWHTVWGELYLRTADGWELAKGGTDGQGLYYETADGGRTYYLFFGSDPQLPSTPGSWEVKDKDMVYISSASTCASSTSSSPPFREPPAVGDTADRFGYCAPKQPESALRGQQNSTAPTRRVGLSGLRSVRSTVPHPYAFTASSGPATRVSATPSLSGTLSASSERGEKSPEVPSPDSSQHPGFVSLFDSSRKFCLLLTGGNNQVKCHRHKCKKYHRHKFDRMTTTFWPVGEQGSERVGPATILVTFLSEDQRKTFCDTISVPPGMQAQLFTVSAT